METMIRTMDSQKQQETHSEQGIGASNQCAGQEAGSLDGSLLEEDVHTTNWDHTAELFEDMGLKESLLRGIYSYGFEKPSAIQKKGIMPVTSGRDCICQAQSGTGKTGTFSISALQLISEAENVCQAVIISPTRELAKQSNDVATGLSMYMNVRTHRLIGGTRVSEDRRILSGGVHIVVGTPGRITAMIESGHLDVTNVKVFILDEADEMLSKGFADQIYDIFRFLPREVQVCLFSATLRPEILKMTEQFMRDPVRILVKNEDITLKGIRQYYVHTEREDWKLGVLSDLYDKININKCIIFVNGRRKCDWLASRMSEMDHTVSAIHGEMTQEERDDRMEDFRRGATRVLIATDILARGIDVQQVSLVINFDLPFEKDNYIHRVGRSGRFGRKGYAINFVSDSDERALQELRTYYATIIEQLPANINDVMAL